MRSRPANVPEEDTLAASVFAGEAGASGLVTGALPPDLSIMLFTTSSPTPCFFKSMRLLVLRSNLQVEDLILETMIMLARPAFVIDTILALVRISVLLWGKAV